MQILYSSLEILGSIWRIFSYNTSSNNLSSNLSSFPHELTLNIFSYLEVRELCECALVDKKWQQLLNDDFLWKTHVMKNFPHIEIQSILEEIPCYKEAYKALSSNWFNQNPEIRSLRSSLTKNCDVDHEYLMGHISYFGGMFYGFSKGGKIFKWNTGSSKVIEHGKIPASTTGRSDIELNGRYFLRKSSNPFCFEIYDLITQDLLVKKEINSRRAFIKLFSNSYCLISDREIQIFNLDTQEKIG